MYVHSFGELHPSEQAGRVIAKEVAQAILGQESKRSKVSFDSSQKTCHIALSMVLREIRMEVDFNVDVN